MGKGVDLYFSHFYRLIFSKNALSRRGHNCLKLLYYLPPVINAVNLGIHFFKQ